MLNFPSFFNAQVGYEIEQSLRFDGSSHLNFTPSSTASTRRQMTFSFWSKHDGTYNIDGVFTSGTSSYYDSVVFDGDTCATAIANSGATGLGAVLYPAARLRDPSAWLHYVMVLDTPNATAGDRLRIYINGERVTAFASSPVAADPDPGQNYDTKYWNTTATHRLGSAAFSGSPDRFFSGYLAEVHCVFGSALDPTDFGEFDNNGVWRPIAYTGSHGTNGFYLTFDPSATNGIGHDHSGNGNNWTASGFTTSGTGTDVMSDTPTTNWCTLNPLDSIGVTSNGNLQSTVVGTSPRGSAGTLAVSSGKWYLEVTMGSTTNNRLIVGIVDAGFDTLSSSSIPTDSTNSVFYFSLNGRTYIDGADATYGATFTTNDVIGIALNIDDDEITFYKNGTSQGTITSKTFSGYYKFSAFLGTSSGSGSFTVNFGQRAFEYTQPTGFNSWSTANLPAPTVKKGSSYFDTVTYSGATSGTAGAGTTQAVTGLGFSPDLVWIKNRSNGNSHGLFDQVRGAVNALRSDLTNAEATTNSSGALSAFNSNGFTLANGSSGSDQAILTHQSGYTYVAWAWDAGGAGSSNTDGTITSTVSANPTAGFSIGTYTADGSNANRTVGHGLGVAPEFIIVKNRDTTGRHWLIWHKGFNDNDKALLFTDAAVADNRFGPSAPTSTVFGLYGGQGNYNSDDHVFYAFAGVEGYSKIGSFVGTGSADGPFVFCGFRPAYVWLKGSTFASNWNTYDSARSEYNAADDLLRLNSAAAEVSDYSPAAIDLLSNGFKIRTSSGDWNSSGQTFVFCAFAEHPFGGSGISPATAR
jgi:hypothetical protein